MFEWKSPFYTWFLNPQSDISVWFKTNEWSSTPDKNLHRDREKMFANPKMPYFTNDSVSYCTQSNTYTYTKWRLARVMVLCVHAAENRLICVKFKESKCLSVFLYILWKVLLWHKVKEVEGGGAFTLCFIFQLR